MANSDQFLDPNSKIGILFRLAREEAAAEELASKALTEAKSAGSEATHHQMTQKQLDEVKGGPGTDVFHPLVSMLDSSLRRMGDIEKYPPTFGPRY